LSNDLGSYYFWTEKPFSRNCGLFFSINDELIKCIERIDLKSKLKATNDANVGILNQRKELLESIYMQKDTNAIAYSYSQGIDVTLRFDVRKRKDHGEWARKYEIYKQAGCIIIKFIKKGERNNELYKYYVAIKSKNTNYDEIEEFTKVEYSHGEESKRYVYTAAKLFTSFFTLSMSDSKFKAIKNATRLYMNYHQIQKKDPRHSTKVETVFAPEEVNVAYKHANSCLNRLINDKGIYKGYPIPPIIKTRDELISIRYLIERKEFKKVKHLFSKYFSHMSYCGRFPATFPENGMKSADSTGWLAYRFLEFIEALEKTRRFSKIYTTKELKNISSFFERLLFFINRYHDKDGLIFSDVKDTWNGQERKGFCIEMQVLHLRVLNVLLNLSGDKKYYVEETRIRKGIVKNFFKKSMLIDSLTTDLKQEKEITPSVFMAYYIYPKLLSKKEWEYAFDNALKSLWDKDGLIKISSNKDNIESYFYINCMSAICLYKINKVKYTKHIEAIVKACCNEALTKGIMGGIPEKSPKKNNLCHATALAMFIEMVKLVFE